MKCRIGGPTILILCSLLLADKCSCHPESSVVIVVLDQADDNSSRTQLSGLQDDLKKYSTHWLYQILSTQSNFSNVLGGWAVIPLLTKLESLNISPADWYFFCPPTLRLNLPKLFDFLSGHDPEESSWFGYGLHDREPTIIHHFSLLSKTKDKFLYPLLSSGFVMSQRLIKSLAERLGSNSSQTDLHRPEFTIDPSYELALFVWNQGQGPTLQHSAKFCLANGPNCLAHPVSRVPCRPLTLTEEIFFAVKTCGKFHGTRVPLVLQTWAKKTKHLEFFSDTPDPLIPGLIDLGIPNTEHGHCGKTEAIIKYIAEKMNKDDKIEWLMISDDDTILSVERLQEFLSCHGPSRSPLALGERYGFRLMEPEIGYSYLTGGGGMVLNRAAVMVLAEKCRCPADDFPDDMYIMGLCLSRLGIPIIHSTLFHQARPDDYAPEYLAMQQPISFHKHWLIDPLEVYKNWFDADFLPEASKLNVHIEL